MEGIRPRAGEPARLRGAAIVVLLWAPFAGLWMLFLRVFVQTTLQEAIYSGVVSMGNAAILSVGVWWISGRYPWPRKLGVRFYLGHAALGMAFSVAWIAMGHVIALMQTGENTLRMLVTTGLLGWRILMGLWLYGLVAGVSYAVRIGRRLVEQERVTARAEARAAEARLETLRSQLNPHFLFNALHTIRALVRLNPDASRDAIEQLGRLLRYSLQRTSRQRVELSEEWSFAEDYLCLESLRLGPRLLVDSDLSQEALRCLVPPFLVQPLVENAVIHGIAPAVDGGCVRVTAGVEGGKLIVAVHDDGVGADPAHLRRGRGHGLLHERLSALYGEAASVTIIGERGQGFEAVATLPAEPAGPVAPARRLATVS